MARESEGEKPAATQTEAYSERLADLSDARWKRWLGVQLPYRMHLRRLRLGFVLDLGCGIGRNLLHLGQNGIGVDPNPQSVARARARGCRAFVPEVFLDSEFAQPGRFDTLLVAHVLEHLEPEAASALLRQYAVFVRSGGRVVLITPQEAGYRSDPTHASFVARERLRQLLVDAGAEPLSSYSFPLPRFCGRLFPHNEFVAIGGRP